MIGNKQRGGANYFDTVMGRHANPSTLDILTACRSADALIRQVQINQEFQEKLEQYKTVERDLDVLLQQVSWLEESYNNSNNEDVKFTYYETANELMHLYDEIQASFPRPNAPRISLKARLADALFVSVAYGASVAINLLLLTIAYGVLALAVIRLITAIL